MSDGTQFNQWQVVFVPFPFSDLSGAKKRPAVLVSTTAFNKTHDDLICCLVTSKITQEVGCPMLGKADLKTGNLPFASKIKPYRLFTIQKNLVLRKLGELTKSKAEETLRELLRLFLT